MGEPKGGTSSQMGGYQKDLFDKTLAQAKQMYNTGQFDITPYGGQRVAGVNPNLKSSWNQARALSNLDPASPQSRAYYGDVLSGKYLTQDAPGMQQILSNVQNKINANSELAGRYGSGSHDTAVSAGLGDVYYDNYARERALQDAAAGGLLGADQFDRTFDANAVNMLNQFGGQQRDIRQQGLDANREKYYEGKNAPINALGTYQSFVTGGNSGSSRGPSGTPLWAQLLGTSLQAGGTAYGNAGTGKGGGVP